MRRGIQLLSLAVFTLFFFFNTFSSRFFLPAELFLQIDPLLSITTCLSSRQFHITLLLSLIILCSAILGGRFFCGYICPLGTILDLAQNKSRDKKHNLRKIKYYILIFLLFSSLFTMNLVYLFDPISFLTRVYTFLIYPLIIILLNSALDMFRPVAEYLHLVELSRLNYKEPVFSLNIITTILFLSLFVMNFFSHRFWCRYLCPLGALLGFFSRFSIFKRQVNANCNSCMKCYNNCPMGAIEEEPRKTAHEECILCNKCSRICPQAAISFKVSSDPLSSTLPQLNLTRRGFFISAGAGAISALTCRIDPASKLSPKRFIRPPGSLPENMFLKMCVRCGECMKICPTNTLQPSFFETGIEGLWAPRLLPRLAGCNQNCVLCGTVCPTDAIRTLSLEEKRHAKIGTAYIDKNRCLVWAQDRLCFICDEQCPYNAIVFRWQNGSRRLFVIENKCNGCGFCEEQCPVKGKSAIIVTAQNEIRLETGSYIKKAKDLNLVLEQDQTDDSFFKETVREIQKKENTRTPQGFIVN